MSDFDHIYPRDTCDLDEPVQHLRDGEPVPLLRPVRLASCPFCGRRIATHNGRLRRHLVRLGARPCPGSDSTVQ